MDMLTSDDSSSTKDAINLCHIITLLSKQLQPQGAQVEIMMIIPQIYMKIVKRMTSQFKGYRSEQIPEEITHFLLSLDDNTILSPTNDNEINIDNIDFGFENIEISWQRRYSKKWTIL